MLFSSQQRDYDSTGRAGTQPEKAKRLSRLTQNLVKLCVKATQQLKTKYSKQVSGKGIHNFTTKAIK